MTKSIKTAAKSKAASKKAPARRAGPKVDRMVKHSAEKIRAIRKARSGKNPMKIAEVVKKFKVGESYIYKIEKGMVRAAA